MLIIGGFIWRLPEVQFFLPFFVESFPCKDEYRWLSLLLLRMRFFIRPLSRYKYHKMRPLQSSLFYKWYVFSIGEFTERGKIFQRWKSPPDHQPSLSLLLYERKDPQSRRKIIKKGLLGLKYVPLRAGITVSGQWGMPELQKWGNDVLHASNAKCWRRYSSASRLCIAYN